MKKIKNEPGNNLNTKSRANWTIFLKDVLICSLGAYGGPEAHYGVFTDQMVVKKKYLSEEELVELIALTTILPGPSSTQTLVSIGYKYGGPLLAFLTLLVWAVPVLIIMTLLSFLTSFLIKMNISQDGLRYIGPMAVGFIVVAAFRIGIKVVTDKVTLALLFFGGITTYLIREPWIYPLVLVMGAIVSIIISKEDNLCNRVKINPPWAYLIVFIIFAIGSLSLSLMYSELVEVNQYMTNQEFLTGLLLIYFVYPVWEGLKGIKGIKISLKGITAVAAGLIAGASIILMQKSGFSLDNIIVTAFSIVILLTKKIPAPLIVLAALVIGFL